MKNVVFREEPRAANRVTLGPETRPELGKASCDPGGATGLITVLIFEVPGSVPHPSSQIRFVG